MTVGPSTGGFVMALAALASVIFAGVGIHELDYASEHPYAYGPARVIAWAAGGGVALSVAVALMGWGLARQPK